MAETSAAQQEIDGAATAIRSAVAARVARDPQQRARLLGAMLWGGSNGGRTGWAIRAANAAIDADIGRSSTPPTLASFEQHAMQRRLDDLRARGVQIWQDANGRWLRETQSKSGTRSFKLVPVETPRQLIQARLARGEIAARRSTARRAAELGISLPKSGPWPANLATFYAHRVGVEAGRIAHDALVDTFRDATFDRLEQLSEQWTRECEPNACGACLALADGRPHPATDRRFYRHTGCRCIPRRWRVGGPNPPTGRELFDAMTETEQDRLFAHRGGPIKARALRAGHIQLTDLVLIASDRLDVTDYVLVETPVHALPLPAHTAQAAT